MLGSSKGITTKVAAWRCFQQYIFGLHTHCPKTRASYSTLSYRWVPGNYFLNRGPITWKSCLIFGKASNTNSQPDKNNSLSLKALFHGPKPALYLGFSGLIPFVSAPVLMATTGTFYPEIAYAQMVYGASIVSFLGGSRWGFSLPDGSPALPDWKNLGNSVVPSLMAWMALLCRDNISEGALIVIMGLGLSLHYDLTLLPGYPSWFKALRTILTLVATFSLIATLALKNIYAERDDVNKVE